MACSTNMPPLTSWTDPVQEPQPPLASAQGPQSTPDLQMANKSLGFFQGSSPAARLAAADRSAPRQSVVGSGTVPPQQQGPSRISQTPAEPSYARQSPAAGINIPSQQQGTGQRPSGVGQAGLQQSSQRPPSIPGEPDYVGEQPSIAQPSAEQQVNRMADSSRPSTPVSGMYSIDRLHALGLCWVNQAPSLAFTSAGIFMLFNFQHLHHHPGVISA